MTAPRSPESPAGWLYGLGAYGLWGLVPLYFRALNQVTPWELLAHRVAWSSLLLTAVLTLLRGWGRFFRCLAAARTRRTLGVTAILIAVNWCLYIYAVATAQVVQASLGYFIAPLVNTALGVAVLGERPRRPQIAAIALAAVGVVVLTVMQGQFPWIALGLAGSFSVYGLLRKTVAADALTGLTVESFALAPAALLFLILGQVSGTAGFGHLNRTTDLLLAVSGVVTVVPLFCFAQAARRLRMTTLGFLQFTSPTVQFLLAVTIMGESFDVARLAGFVPIWIALVIYAADALLAVRRNRHAIAG